MGSEISKKDITRLGFRSSLLQASFNYERMQAGGFTWAMLPILKKIYKDDKPGLSAAMKDNLEFINTHPNLVGFLMGLLISMEEKGENRDTIKGLKVALFGPIAGIGDAIFWFTLLPIMAGGFSSFFRQGEPFGAVFFLSKMVWQTGSGDLLIVCQSGEPVGTDFVFRRLPAYLFPARRLDPRRLFSRREGYR